MPPFIDLHVFLRNVVELEGIEPSSKQGDHKLSTCLVQFGFS